MIQNRDVANSYRDRGAVYRGRPGNPNFDRVAGRPVISMREVSQQSPRKLIVGLILIVALLAFEVFNFDTTRYALQNLLGGITFLRIEWAAILAIAFCSIDFAGLTRLFTADRSREMPKEVWYLMGAWLLGATMNAMMTWWAITLVLLNHDFGNEVLSREQLLHIVPIFVAVLVWLTRILFIGAFTVAGDKILDWRNDEGEEEESVPVQADGYRGRPLPAGQSLVDFVPHNDDLPGFLKNRPQAPAEAPLPMAPPQARQRPPANHNGPANEIKPANGAGLSNGVPLGQPKRDESRVRQRPPMPNLGGRMASGNVQARGRRR